MKINQDFAISSPSESPGLSTYIWTIFSVSVAALLATTWFGLSALENHEYRTSKQYDEWIISSHLINQISNRLRDNRNEVTLLLQHYSGNAVANQHPEKLHVEKIFNTSSLIDADWQLLRAELQKSDKLAALGHEFETRRQLSLAHIQQIVSVALAEKLTAKWVIDDSVDGVEKYRATTSALSDINTEIIRLAKEELISSDEYYKTTRNRVIILSALVFFFLSVFVVFTIQRLKSGIQSVTSFADEIASGNLSLSLPATPGLRPREFNRILDSIGAMRTKLLEYIKDAQKGAAQSEAVLRTMRDGIIMIDSHGKILSVNDALSETFGYAENELPGQKINILMGEQDAAAHSSHMARYMSDRIPHKLHRRVELVGKKKTGELFPIEMVVNEMVDDDGSVFIGVVRDVVQQHQIQRDLSDALAKAQVATEAKSAFLANMSHEIRTPINAVIGFSGIALVKNYPEEIAAAFRKINNAGKSLLALINDILDISKIEAGKLELDKCDFDLSDVIKHVDLILGNTARNKSIELVIGISPSVPTQLVGDPYRLGQILINLAGNAIKFTQSGSVTVLVEVLEVNQIDALAKLRFVVTDTGIGMTPDEQSRVFGAFLQADSSTTRRFGGTGLGLAITKQLVEQMGGELLLSSEVNKGSEFSFVATLGLATPPETERQNDLLKDKSILVMDDNPIMLALLMKTLESLGCNPSKATSGQEALALIRGGQDFDALMFDWHLPEMTGEEVAGQLRADNYNRPIILVSGHSPEIVGAEMSRLFNAAVNKPISVSAVRHALVSALGGEMTTTDAQRRADLLVTKIPSLKGEKILLVDDNHFNREVGAALIDMTAADCVLANDGLEAVNLVRQGEIDLVLLDLQMPVMDGYEAAKIIKAEYPTLPIVALTAHAMIEERQRVIAAGMNDMLSKPIDQDKFFKVIEKWLSNSAEAALTSSMVSKPEKNTVNSSIVARLKTEGITFDQEGALSRVNGNVDLLKRFIKLFIERNSNAASDIFNQVAEKDLPAAKRTAHMLKGSAGTVGLVAIQHIAAHIEVLLDKQINTPFDSFNYEYEQAAKVLDTEWQHGLNAISKIIE